MLQANYKILLLLTILFNINHLFADTKVVTSIKRINFY